MTINNLVSRRKFIMAATGSTVVASVTPVAGQAGTNNTTDNETEGNATGNATGNGTGNATGGDGQQTGPIDFGGYLDDLTYWSGQAVDLTGQDTVQITVGASANNSLSFEPVAVHVDPGTAVTWEWSGNGGAHNVVSETDAFTSGSPTGEAGTTFAQTFEEDGIFNYYCDPHRASGMLGSVAVGSVPRTAPVTPAPPAVDTSTKQLAVGVAGTMAGVLGLVFFFLKYGGDYE